MADVELKAPALSPAAYAALVYLALPSFAFLTQWVVMPAGGALAALLFGTLLYVRRAYGCRFDATQAEARRRLALCLIVALAWVALGGIGHAVFTNSDWQVRDAVFRDLALTGWPLNYGADGNDLALLRTPPGYYLIPALVGKVFGLAALNPAVFLWTALGVFLFLALVTAGCRSLRDAAILVAVITLFSGMKFIGMLAMQAYYGQADVPFLERLTYYTHMWSHIAHYSSLTTELYWSPNHALTEWLLMGLWWRYRDTPRLLQIGVLALPLGLLWSPFAVLGMAPFMAWSLFEHRKALFEQLSPWLVALSILFALPPMFYLTLGSGKIMQIWLPERMIGMPDIIGNYLMFVVLEFGLLIAALYALMPQRLLLMIAALLTLLPLYWFGLWSDLAQHAAMPSLLALALITGQWIAAAPRRLREWPLAGKLLLLMLAIGAIVPLQEWGAALWKPAWEYNDHCTLVDAWRSNPNIPPTMATYVAKLDAYPAILQPPHSVVSQRAKDEPCWPRAMTWPGPLSELWQGDRRRIVAP